MADVKSWKKEEHLTLRVRTCALAMFVLAVLAIARPTVAGGPPPIPPTFDNLHYDSHWQQKLDLYIPAGSPECGSWPVVIFVFGGGWLAGDETQVEPYVEPLMSRGFAIAAISYRVSGQAIFPAQIHDCKAAIRWLRANAATYALDPDRFAIFGDSAGGHLASLVGTSTGVASLEGDVGGNLDQPSNVHVVGDFAGPIDLIEYSQVYHSQEVAALFGYRWWFELPLGDPEFFALIQSADPAIHATTDDPPFRIVHGDADSLVPFSNAVYLHDALVNVGVPSSLALLPGVGHSIPDSAYEPVFDYFVEVLTPPDSDDDGVPDACDGCPNDPLKTEPGACGCGTPDTDSDGDATPDCIDGCPNDPDKIDPGVCGCGAPDTDTDEDGIADCLDNCDNIPNVGQADCDGDGTGDVCEAEPDCNANDVPDSCDITSGTSVDSNSNGIPDECECAANVATDGASADQVDVDDLIAIILGWGACEMRCPPYCAEDVDRDCQIDVDDLIAVISAWGPCP
jgi:acetyl esterase/lipase